MQAQQTAERPGEEMWKAWESKIATSFPRANPMSTQALASLLEAHPEEVVLLDVRGAPEYLVSRLHESAIRLDDSNFNLNEIKQLLEHKPNATVVCYCSIGFRSSKLAQTLVDSNEFPTNKIFNLQGGLFQWANENRPLVKVDEDTYEVIPALGAHPYNSTFGQMLDAKYHMYPENHEGSWCVVS
ncbi:hypothetical protein BASA81_006740 [Batrachochytrium salamandrivorans]|nr:hypothetical protein BASA81_006740 [Batrachochytrium salamandrivorans]